MELAEDIPQFRAVRYYRVSSILDLYDKRAASISPELPPIKPNPPFHEERDKTRPMFHDKGCMKTESKTLKLSIKNHFIPLPDSEHLLKGRFDLKNSLRRRPMLKRQTAKCTIMQLMPNLKLPNTNNKLVPRISPKKRSSSISPRDYNRSVKEDLLYVSPKRVETKKSFDGNFNKFEDSRAQDNDHWYQKFLKENFEFNKSLRECY